MNEKLVAELLLPVLLWVGNYERLSVNLQIVRYFHQWVVDENYLSVKLAKYDLVEAGLTGLDSEQL